MRRVHERDLIALRTPQEIDEHDFRRARLEFPLVALRKLQPLRRIVLASFGQLAEWCDILRPRVEMGLRLGYGTRPEPIDQHTVAV